MYMPLLSVGKWQYQAPAVGGGCELAGVLTVHLQTVAAWLQITTEFACTGAGAGRAVCTMSLLLVRGRDIEPHH